LVPGPWSVLGSLVHSPRERPRTTDEGLRTKDGRRTKNPGLRPVALEDRPVRVLEERGPPGDEQAGAEPRRGRQVGAAYVVACEEALEVAAALDARLFLDEARRIRILTPVEEHLAAGREPDQIA